MLCWTSGNTRRDRIKYDNIKRENSGNTYSRKDVKSKFRWFEHVERRLVNYV